MGLRGKVCVELGSGIGLSGIVLQRLGPKICVLTDLYAAVRENMKTNLRLNSIDVVDVDLPENEHWSTAAAEQQVEAEGSKCAAACFVGALDMSSPELERFECDVIVAADV